MGESVLTEGFPRAKTVLRCEGVDMEAITRAAGTPVYVYSSAAIRDQYSRLSSALAPVNHRIHYSVKANSNLAVLSLLRELGAGVDIVSGGELFRARRAGYAGDDIVFGGVGKTESELREALHAGVQLINVESEAELRLLDRVASESGRVAPVGLRVNPEVTVDTPHPYTRTGERGMKFGIPHDEAIAVARLALALPNVQLVGLDMHIGSQVTGLAPYHEGLKRLLELHDALRTAGAHDLRILDIGGGFAVTYDDESPTDIDALADTLLPAIAKSRLALIVEPGRFLVGNAGILLTRVLYRKRSGGREYIITDAGMSDLLRPSHYNAFHRIEPVRPRHNEGVSPDEQETLFDVVGPVCESGDFFALERPMGDVRSGDLLAIRSAGAYGFVMSSNYNARPRPAEVLVDGDRFAIVTSRESYEDLVRGELPPRWLAG